MRIALQIFRLSVTPRSKMTTRPASREPRHSVTLGRNGRLAERPSGGEAVSQPELDLSDMDDFEVIEERRRVQTALAFLA